VVLTCDVCSGEVAFGNAQTTPEDVICETCLRKLIGHTREYRANQRAVTASQLGDQIDRQKAASGNRQGEDGAGG
jgi:hypothetical protein